MSIFVWRLLANRIPVDAKLQWRNIQLASKCRCCKNPSGETREHFFIQGEVAAKIWRYFANWFPDAPPIPVGTMDLVQRIRWWQQGITARIGRDHVTILIPCLILWFIWTERNNVVFNSGIIQNYLQWAVSARKLDARQWKGSTPKVKFNFPQSRPDKTPRTSIIRRNQTGLNLTRTGPFRMPTFQRVAGESSGMNMEGFWGALQISLMQALEWKLNCTWPEELVATFGLR